MNTDGFVTRTQLAKLLNDEDVMIKPLVDMTVDYLWPAILIDEDVVHDACLTWRCMDANDKYLGWSIQSFICNNVPHFRGIPLTELKSQIRKILEEEKVDNADDVESDGFNEGSYQDSLGHILFFFFRSWMYTPCLSTRKVYMQFDKPLGSKEEKLNIKTATVVISSLT